MHDRNLGSGLAELKLRINSISFRQRILLALVALGFIPIIVLISIVLPVSRVVLVGEAEERLIAVADLKTVQVFNWIEQGRTVARLVSNLYFLKTQFPKYLSTDDTNARKKLAQSIRSYVEKTASIFPYVNAVSILDGLSGRVLISTDLAQEGRDRSAEDYYLNGRKDLFTTSIVYSVGREKPVLTIGAPLRDVEGTLAVVTVEMEFKHLQAILGDNIGLGMSGYTFLVDAYGFYVTTPPNITAGPLRKVARSEGVQMVLSGRDGTMSYLNSDGIGVLGHFRRLENTELALVAEIHKKEIMIHRFRFRYWILFSGLFLLFFFYIVARFLAHSLTNPLQKIVTFAKSLQMGNLDQRTTMNRADEIGQLAGVLNAMATSLEDSVRNLEDLVKKRTSQLEISNIELREDIEKRRQTEKSLRESEEKLVQAQRMEAVGKLAGGVAHDFNNLLTTILGYSEMMLAESALAISNRQGVEEIMKAARRAASLTQQLLAFGRKQVRQPVALNLNVLVTDLKKMLARLIGENIELSTRLEPELGLARVDPGQIEQIVMNLSINSRDAMPSGGKLIIQTQNADLAESFREQHPEVVPGKYVLLTVSDTGCGMDEETVNRAFEPFFTTKGVGEGTGLGLSTVYGIVKQNEGYVWINSEPNRGTSFKIYFLRTDEPEEHREIDVKRRLLTGGMESILLVEDEEELRKMTVTILKRQGYIVVEARSGTDALDAVAKHPEIDLLVTDVIMPEMGGKELSEKIRKNYPKLKILYVSGYTNAEIATRGLLDEGVSLLQKPFSLQSLTQRIREELDRD